MIIEDYVSFGTAKLLKEKEFDEFTISYYSNDGLIGFMEVETRVFNGYQRPTLQMAMKWLREREIFVEVTHTLFSSPHKYQYSVFRTEPEFYTTSDGYESYEEACEAGIKYCLENLI